MWDGRFDEGDLLSTLAVQANDATQGHAAAPEPISQEIRESIVDFEIDLFNAQSHDDDAKELDAVGARGGPEYLAGESGEGSGFDIYDAWHSRSRGGTNEARASIARGQEIFNARNCVNCHTTGNVGNDARARFFDIGISAAARRSPDLPLYTLRNRVTGQVRQTSDPGRALITGRWSDVDRFKVPGLRGLAARAPYFHDGSAATLDDVVEHYDLRFALALSAQEKEDLAAFLRAL